jgi:hypothetical protein
MVSLIPMLKCFRNSHRHFAVKLLRVALVTNLSFRGAPLACRWKGILRSMHGTRAHRTGH